MLDIEPRSAFSWNFDVVGDGTVIAQLEMSSWRERGEIVLHEGTVALYRDGMRGPFLLETNGMIYATAVKEGVFRNSFVVELADRTYQFKKISTFKRAFVLTDDGVEVGWMKPVKAISRKAQASFPEDLPLAVHVFLIWLALIIWKREED